MENIDNLILEHLKNFRIELNEFRQDTREELQTIKMRLNSVERGVAGIHDDIAILQMQLDRVGGRIDKIEKRLELSA